MRRGDAGDAASRRRPSQPLAPSAAPSLTESAHSPQRVPAVLPATADETDMPDVNPLTLTVDSSIPTYRPQYERIAELIVEYIRTHQLHPDDRLPTEQEFAEQFGVSRAIVRDAIKVLTPSGVVRTRRGSGIFVGEQKSLSASAPLNLAPLVPPEHIGELFAFRCIQEMQTARLAAQHVSVAELRAIEQSLTTNRQAAAIEDWDIFLRSDDEFHHGIALAAHNLFLVEAVASILRLQRWAIKVLTGGAPGSMQAAVQQHGAIFDAIRDGSPDRAAEAARIHVESVFANYQQEARRRLIGEHQPD
jgi:GntR family transcriptional regulator, transcriptional repressor for pyruvate dehydrogenase complex